MWNMKPLTLTIQNPWPMLKFLVDKETDREVKNYMPSDLLIQGHENSCAKQEYICPNKSIRSMLL